MKSNVPWSVKGIDPEARVVAKEAARKAGMTLGEWMTTMINEVSSDGPGRDGTAAGAASGPLSGVTPEQLRAVVDSLNRLNERIKSAEENLKRHDERARQAVGGLNQGLETVFERLKRIEREGRQPETTPVPQVLFEGERERVDSLKSLERALVHMVEQFEATRRDAITRVEQNERSVAALSQRVDGLDSRLTAGFQEVHDALDAVGQHLDTTERTAKAVMLEAQAAVGSADSEFVERTSRKLQLLGNEIKRSGDQIAAVEELVGALARKIEAAEQRSAEGVSDVVKELEALRVELDASLDSREESGWRRAAVEVEETVAGLEKSYRDIIARQERHAAASAVAPTVTATFELDTRSDAAYAAAAARMTPAAAPVAAPAMAAPVAPAPAPAKSAPIDPDADFDAVFGEAPRQIATDTPDAFDDALAPAVAAAAPAEVAYQDGVRPTDLPADPPAPPMSPREKILAAARARQERLAREDVPPAAAPQMSDLGGQRVSSAPAPEAAVGPDGRNKRLGLPLVVLLGLLALAIVIAAAVFFSQAAEDKPSDEAAAVTTDAENPDAATDATIPPQLASPASAPDGAALYSVAKSAIASATTPEDRARAFGQMRDAALAGNVPAQYRLGEMFFSGMGTEQNLQNAKRWFTEAALSGNAAAMHRLGSLAIDPAVDGQNFSLALEWFGRAANFGVVDSMYNLGYLYDPTTDILPAEMRDPAKAFYWYLLASEQGDQQAGVDGANVGARLTEDRIAEIRADVSSWAPLPADPAVNDGLSIDN